MRSRRVLRDDDLDGLTAEEVRRIRAAGEAAAVPGLEAFAGGSGDSSRQAVPSLAPDPPVPIRSTDPLPGKKHARGRRMT